MSKLKVAEIFYSLQGEGRYAGVPSVFLRTFGCNFQCRGFAMPKGQITTEPDEIAEVVQTLPDAPLLSNENIETVLDGVRPFLSEALMSAGASL